MEHETKLENEVTNGQAKTVLTQKEKKENKTHSPQLPALLHFVFKSYLHKLPRTKLTVK